MQAYENVLILGATGLASTGHSFGLGTLIARAFLPSPRKWKVKILARESAVQPKQDPAKNALLESYKAQGAVIVYGDVQQPATLTHVFAGTDLVVSVLSGTGMYGQDTAPELNAIRAAHAAGVKRFVPSSWTYDVRAMSATDPRTLHMYLVKREALDLLAALVLEYTVFDTIWFEFLCGPAMGFDLQSKTVALPGDGSIRYSAIALEDIATLVEVTLAHPQLSRNAHVQLATDEFSANEMVDIFEHESGVKFTRKYIPIDEIRQKQLDTAQSAEGVLWNFRRVYAEEEHRVYFPQPFNRVHKEFDGVPLKGYRQWIREFVAKHKQWLLIRFISVQIVNNCNTLYRWKQAKQFRFNNFSDLLISRKRLVTTSAPLRMSTDDLLDCPICSEKFTNAHETSCCHHCFCKACAEEWIQKTNTCPSCRKEITTNDLSASVPIQRLVDILPVECPNAAKGCDSKRLTRGMVKEHLDKSCGYTEVPCPLECGAALLRKDMAAHQQDDCPRRLTACEQCGEMINKHLLADHVQDTCKKTKVHCPNNCGKDIEREALAPHLKDECHAIELTCPYSKYGCAFKGSRAEFKKHLLEETEEHIKLIDQLTAVRALETSTKDSEIQALERELISTKQCLEQFLILKPSLPYHPMDKQPVVLPTHFKPAANSKLELSIINDTITVKRPMNFPFNMQRQTKESVTLAANIAIPIVYPNVYYFEVQVLELDASAVLSIGISPADKPLEGLPGWKHGSFGFHSDDGRVYYEDFQQGINCSTPFGKGSTIGCGWDMRAKELFFTVNGMSLGFQFRNIPLKPFLPVIGFLFNTSGKVVVKPNFGTQAFCALEPTKYHMPTTAGVKEMLIKHNCTYYRTARNYSPQFWVQCFTCGLNTNSGVCMTCANTCHKGHTLGTIQYGDFFCDCFESPHCTLHNNPPK